MRQYLGPLDLKPLAGVGISDRNHEEADAEGQHNNIQHEELLAVLFRTRQTRLRETLTAVG